MAPEAVNIGNLLHAPVNERTVAHYKVAAFYRKTVHTPGESIVARIARAVSLFDLEACLKDAALFAPEASQKTKDGWARAAEVRLAQLTGVLYIGGAK